MRFVLAVLILSLFASAQGTNGEIQLKVTDPSGAAVRFAGVSVVGIRRFETDAMGQLSILGLRAGTYRMEISKTGFETEALMLEVQPAGRVERNVTLQIGRARTSIQVAAATPLTGVNLGLDQIASPVQVATQKELMASGAVDLSDFLNRRLNGVHVNEIQGNPFQSDLNYRGYTASPLLGTPQGMSIYMDGVRMNQAFGDSVSWDLIPRIAISEVTLMPGSNPLFGLNTLGGAVAVETKDGLGATGTSVQLVYGSKQRRSAELEHGGAFKNFNWYGASNLFFDEGWRDSSPTNVRQFFGRLGWRREKTDLNLKVSYANNSLTGNQLQEERLLARDYASVYTKPDITNNKSPFVNLGIRRNISKKVTATGNLYFRNIHTSVFNGDINEGSLDQSVYQPSAADRTALAAAGYSGFPLSGATAANTPFPFWRCIAQALQRDEPGEKCNGLLNRSYVEQSNYGAAGQATWHSEHNQFSAGAGFDHSKADFRQSTQLGYLNADRGITGINAFADGVTGGNINGEPYDLRVDLSGIIQTWSILASDTLTLGKWNLTASGRYNRTSLRNHDRIRPGGGVGSLDGVDVFGRLNAAIGMTYTPWAAANLYASYSEGSRGPTSIELGCADPDRPCRLPNSAAGDPPLRQVVARTLEAGARGRLGRGFHWNVGAFRAENSNDVLFVSSSLTGYGYFKNFGKTRRQGAEFGLDGKLGRVSIGGGYTLLEATYQTMELLNGSSNSSNNARAKGLDGSIAIQPGDRIPLIPQHTLKSYAGLAITSKLVVDLGLIAISGSYARGNENNHHQPDGTYFLGPGATTAYAVMNAGARYTFGRRWMLVGQINNLLNRHYNSAAQLGPTGFRPGGEFLARALPAVGADFPTPRSTFYAPGAPRLAWVGMRFRF